MVVVSPLWLMLPLPAVTRPPPGLVVLLMTGVATGGLRNAIRGASIAPLMSTDAAAMPSAGTRLSGNAANYASRRARTVRPTLPRVREISEATTNSRRARFQTRR